MAVTAWLVPAAPAAAQSGQPGSILNIVNRTTLSTAQVTQIDAYVEWYVERLAAGGDQTVEAYRKLLEPVATKAASRSFRGAFASASVNRLRDLARSSDNPLVASNAIIVLSKIGTVEALDALIELSDPRNTTWTSRLGAARGVVTLVQDDYTSAFDDRVRLRVGRRLSQFANAEQDARVLRYLLDGILRADSDELDAGTRTDLFGNYASALRTVASRGRGDVAFALAAGASVATTRNRFLELQLNASLQADMARAIAPSMVELLAAYEAHWGLREDAASAGLDSEIERAEIALTLLLSRVAPSVNTGEAAAAAWRDGDRAQFERAVGAFRAALPRG